MACRWKGHKVCDASVFHEGHDYEKVILNVYFMTVNLVLVAIKEKAVSNLASAKPWRCHRSQNRCTRRNMKLPRWSKNLNSKAHLGINITLHAC